MCGTASRSYWDVVMPWSQDQVQKRSEGKNCLHLQGSSVSQAIRMQKPWFRYMPGQKVVWARKMEPICLPLGFYQTTWHNICPVRQCSSLSLLWEPQIHQLVHKLVVRFCIYFPLWHNVTKLLTTVMFCNFKKNCWYITCGYVYDRSPYNISES
jgi:hypothetical protein